MSSRKKNGPDATLIKVVSTDPEIGLTAESLTKRESAASDQQLMQLVQLQSQIKAATLNELAKSIVAALNNTGVGSWKTTLEVSLTFGIVGIKGTLELASK